MENEPIQSEEKWPNLYADASLKRQQEWRAAFNKYSPLLQEKFQLLPKDTLRFWLDLTNPVYVLAKQQEEKSQEDMFFLLNSFPQVVELYADSIKAETPPSKAIFEVIQIKWQADEEWKRRYDEEISLLMRADGIDPDAVKAEVEGEFDDAVAALRKYQKYGDRICESESFRPVSEKIRKASTDVEIAFFGWIEGVLKPKDPLRSFFLGLSARSQPSALLAPAQISLLADGNNSPATMALTRAIMLKDRRDLWKLNENAGHMHCEDKHGDFTYQTVEVAEWLETQREDALDVLVTRFKDIKNDILADVIDILFHHWNTFPYPKKRDRAYISVAQICAYRGVKPEGDNIKIAYRAAQDARGFRLKSGGLNGALFDMDEAELPQNLFGHSPAEPETVLVYSPGFFLAEAIENSPTFLAPYLQEIWKLNPKYHSITKRLARYLRAEWRLNTQAYLRAEGKPRNRFRTWAAILDAAGEDVEEWRGGKDPSRLIKAVEKSLLKLEEIGFIESASVSIYEHPSHYKNLPRKGILPEWLALRVHIAPSQTIREELEPTNQKRIARGAREAEKKMPQLQPKSTKTRAKVPN